MPGQNQQHSSPPVGPWSTVRLGLTVMLGSALAVILTFVLLAAYVGYLLLLGQSPARFDASALPVLAPVVLGLSIIAYLIGICFCLKAPQGHRQMSGAVLCLVAILFVSLIVLAYEVFTLRDQNRDVLQFRAMLRMFALIANILLTLGVMMSVVRFLRVVAETFSRPVLSGACTAFLRTLLFLIFLLALEWLLISQSAEFVPGENTTFFGMFVRILLGLITILSLTLSLALALWKFALLWLVRDAIRTLALSSLFESDEAAWLEAMAELIQLRRFGDLDYVHLGEYLADMARRERREV